MRIGRIGDDNPDVLRPPVVPMSSTRTWRRWGHAEIHSWQWESSFFTGKIIIEQCSKRLLMIVGGYTMLYHPSFLGIHSKCWISHWHTGCHHNRAPQPRDVCEAHEKGDKNGHLAFRCRLSRGVCLRNWPFIHDLSTKNGSTWYKMGREPVEHVEHVISPMNISGTDQYMFS
jgi:hypothetical protein